MHHVFDWGLIATGIPLCLVSRAVNIFPLGLLVNMFRKRKLPMRVQAMQWWCGLRGAVAYALAINMPMLTSDQPGGDGGQTAGRMKQASDGWAVKLSARRVHRVMHTYTETQHTRRPMMILDPLFSTRVLDPRRSIWLTRRSRHRLSAWCS